MLAAPGGLVRGGDLEDAVGIDVKGDLDLRDAARGGWNAIQDELAQRLVVHRHRALTLQDMDLHLCLAVAGSGEYLAFAGGDGGVALDERCGHAAQGFNRECQRGHIQQQDILDLAAQDARLDGCTQPPPPRPG